MEGKREKSTPYLCGLSIPDSLLLCVSVALLLISAIRNPQRRCDVFLPYR
jgi:hypothetical protein